MADSRLCDTGKMILEKFKGIAGISKQIKLSNEVESNGKLALLPVNILSEMERFQLWAANLGLFVVGDRSLDYRMRDNLTVREYTGNLLDELEEDLSNIFELLKEGTVVRKDEHQYEEQIDLETYHIGGPVSNIEQVKDRGDPEDENLENGHDVETQSVQSDETDAPDYSNIEAARAEFDDVIDIVDRLYSLAARLRGTTARNPPSARNFYRDLCSGSDGNELILNGEEKAELRKKAKEQTERFHYRRIKEIVRQAFRDEAGKSHPEESERVKPGSHDKKFIDNEARNPHLEARIKLDPRTKAVIRRIAIGNAYRQQQFIFWRQREWDRRDGVARQGVQETKDNSRKQTSKIPADRRAEKETGNQELQISDDRKVTFSELSQTWKMPKEKDLSPPNETRSQSSKSEQETIVTVYEPGGGKVKWPDFPKELDGNKSFICPYCFVTCPPKYRRKGHWRRHLIQDLQPYTCTAPVCVESDNKPLNTWEEWVIHEQIHHRMEYTCSSHPAQSFPSREQYVDHITSAHSDSKEELFKSQKIDQCAQLSPKPTDGCPLCSYTADNWPDMDKHIGFHLETLGLLGLPLATGLEKDKEEMASLRPEGVRSNLNSDILQDVATEYGEINEESHIKWEQESSRRSLQLAAKDGNEEIVRMLLHTGQVEVDLKDSGGRTPLSWAAASRHEIIVKLLLQTGKVEVDLKDSGGQTPLSWAAGNGHEAVVKLLLQTGKVEVDLKDSDGQTPLSWAALNGHEAVARLLLRKGADAAA